MQICAEPAVRAGALVEGVCFVRPHVSVGVEEIADTCMRPGTWAVGARGRAMLRRPVYLPRSVPEPSGGACLRYASRIPGGQLWCGALWSPVSPPVAGRELARGFA